jgi:hypothetical protein
MLGTLFNLIYIIYLGFKEDENSKIKKLYLAGLVLIFISIGFYFATLTPRKNNIEYSLSNERYSIPWEYNPAQSGAPANSEYVTIHVSYPLFNSQYSDENYLHERLAITKSIIDKKYMKGEPLDTYCLTEPCKSVTNDLNTYFIDNNFIYKVSYHGQGITFVTKNELENFKIKIINLFETFKVQ